MKSAVDFLSNILRSRNPMGAQVDDFRQALLVVLCSHYQDHWFPEKPMKGSGYRCIRINHKMDPLLAKAGGVCGLSEEKLFDLFPRELTLWIDPEEVSYRIGEDGSVGVIFGEDADVPSESSSGNDQQQQQQHHQSNNNVLLQDPSSLSSSLSSSTPPSPQCGSPSPPSSPQMVNTSDFIQSCKSQLMCFGLESATDAINLEYLQSHLATFVTS